MNKRRFLYENYFKYILKPICMKTNGFHTKVVMNIPNFSMSKCYNNFKYNPFFAKSSEKILNAHSFCNVYSAHTCAPRASPKTRILKHLLCILSLQHL